MEAHGVVILAMKIGFLQKARSALNARMGFTPINRVLAVLHAFVAST